jgi:hypothetical protein
MSQEAAIFQCFERFGVSPAAVCCFLWDIQHVPEKWPECGAAGVLPGHIRILTRINRQHREAWRHAFFLPENSGEVLTVKRPGAYIRPSGRRPPLGAMAFP